MHVLTVTAIVATLKWYHAHSPYERATLLTYPATVYARTARDHFTER